MARNSIPSNKGMNPPRTRRPASASKSVNKSPDGSMGKSGAKRNNTTPMKTGSTRGR